MYKTATILYLVIFSLYILFSRQPDYFDSEFTRGTIVETRPYHKAIRFREGTYTYTIPLNGWGASQVAAGDTVKIIFDPSKPATSTLYSFFSYWLSLPELLVSALAFVVLFAAAVLITGRQEVYYYTDEEKRKKRKYDD